MFEGLEPKPNLPELEAKVLEFWNTQSIFKRSVENRSGGKPYILYDGPPTANAVPHVGSALTQVYKDVFPRYKTMKGFYAPRSAGWDTHGLPVELEVEKELGFKSKHDIEKFGIAKFNELCKASVWKYKAEWEDLIPKIGYWEDLSKPYITYEADYIDKLWGIIRQFHDKELLYKGYKVVPYCPRCGTSLSSHEVALGYDDKAEDPSVYVKFKIKDEEGYFLVWTTTPWTLPSNVALAFNPEIKYVKIRTKDKNGQESELVLAKDKLEIIKDKYEVLAESKGTDLADLYYEPLYDARESKDFKKDPEKEIYKTVLADFVSTAEGTGIVHIAPAYGAEDLEVGKKDGLAFLHFVDERGDLLAGPIEAVGIFAKDADKPIIDELTGRGLVYQSGTVVHTYPFCWRCNTPLLYYAHDSWFVAVTKVKEQLLANNNQINWVPAHLKAGRFGNFLEQVVDWNFSRSRYWGTPLPVWECESGDNTTVIGSIAELKERSKTPLTDDFDPHRPFVDEVIITCEKCGRDMKRVPDLVDVWFDSGSMPFASEQAGFPADYISEGVDQTRGWFYTLLAVSTLLGKGHPYRNVISFYHVLDEAGKKMSKSKGNAIDPRDAIAKYGADPLRFYLLRTSFVTGPRQFALTDLDEAVKGFFMTLWNSYSFFISYANIDKWNPENLYTNFVQYEQRPLLDRWMISTLNKLIADVDKSLDTYDATNAVKHLEAFLDDLSNWYIRRSRRRFWKSEAGSDKESAYQTLYEVLKAYAQLLAPFTPFIAEYLFQKFSPDSVHMSDWPKSDSTLVDEVLNSTMHKVRAAVKHGLSARAAAKIKVRQPLSAAVVISKPALVLDPELLELLASELNVKNVEFAESADALGKDFEIWGDAGVKVAVNTKMTPELEQEGLARELIRQIQSLRKKAGYELTDRIAVTLVHKSKKITAAMKVMSEMIAAEVLASKIDETDAIAGAVDISLKLTINGQPAEVGLKKVTI